jgi:DNA-binding Lrp family transcriptional regulator
VIFERIDASHQDISKVINKSPPAIGARILKMERAHLIATQYGIDLEHRIGDVVFALVQFQAKNPEQITQNLLNCPAVVNVFSTLGTQNMMVWLLSTSMDKIEEIVDAHLRSNAEIRHMNLVYATETVKSIVVPFNFDVEAHERASCKTCDLTPEKTMNPDGNECDNGSLLFDIDADDKRIMKFLQQDPEMTHTSIGHAIGKSQPAVGMRIQKLKDKHVFLCVKGVNFRLAEKFSMLQLSIVSLDVNRTLEKLRNCPDILAGFKVTGGKSIVAYIAGHSIEKLNSLIDTCIRKDPDICEVETTNIIREERDFILPYDFEFEPFKYDGCMGCKYASINNINGCSIAQPNVIPHNTRRANS